MQKPEGTRLLLLDDHPIVLEALGHRIASEDGLRVVGTAINCREAMAAIDHELPDVIVTDLKHDDEESVLETIRELHESYGELPILVFSAQDESIYAAMSLRLGARGFLSKRSDGDEVLRAIRKVAAGEIFVSEAVAARMVEQGIAAGGNHDHDGGDSDSTLHLSAREFEVFELVGMGKTSKAIAAELGISLKTVESHRGHIKTKLGLEAGANLIQYAVRWVSARVG